VLSVGLSTLFFSTVGIDRWALLSCLWALLPLLNIILFLIVPIYPNPDEAKGEPPHFRALFRQKIFWLMVLLMVCSGASELAIAQWASTFTESALGVTKTVGDLVGVCGFAVMMAIARSLYARLDTKIPLKTALIACSLLCIGGYLLIGLSSSSVLGLVGCAISGFAVGIFWPASYSTATLRVRKGGTALFSLLALSGDLGCTLGPTLVGAVSGAFGDNFRLGILAAVIFPIVLLLGLVGLHILDRKSEKTQR
jgi:fucose permease